MLHDQATVGMFPASSGSENFFSEENAAKWKGIFLSALQGVCSVQLFQEKVKIGYQDAQFYIATCFTYGGGCVFVC